MKAKKILSVLLAVCLMACIFSGCAATGGTASAEAGASGSMASSLIMMAMIFVIMYFLMIRPGKKRKKQAEEMRNNVEVGDKIITIGGMVGRVVHVTSDRITFETGEDRVRIEVTKWALSSNEGKGSKEKSDSEETLEG